MFMAETGGTFWIADADGSDPQPFNLQPLLEPQTRKSGFSWSSDSEWLAFVESAGYDGTVSCCRSGGTDYFSVGTGKLPKWSPVKNQLAFIREDMASFHWWPTGALMLLNITDRSTKMLVNIEVSNFSWSPDGQWITYQQTAEPANPYQDVSFDAKELTNIWKININTGEAICLTESDDAGRPVWLPDDSGFIFLRGSRYNKLAIWRMDTDGSNTTNAI